MISVFRSKLLAVLFSIVLDVVEFQSVDIADSASPPTALSFAIPAIVRETNRPVFLMILGLSLSITLAKFRIGFTQFGETATGVSTHFVPEFRIIAPLLVTSP